MILLLKGKTSLLAYFLGVSLATLFLSPIAVNFLQIGGKPLDICVSDCIVVLLVFAYVVYFFTNKIRQSEVQILTLLLLALFFHLCLAWLGTLDTGSLVPLLSAFKYVKVFLAAIAGMCVARLLAAEDFWQIGAIASFVVLVCLCVTQFILLGNFNPRWGSSILGFDVYGFPNSAASYYIVLALFPAVALLQSRYVFLNAAIFLMTGLFAVMSLSRSAVAVLLVFILLLSLSMVSIKYLVRISSAFLVLIPAIFFIVYQGVVEEYIPEEIGDSLSKRWDRTFSSSDPTSGRVEIAVETLDLVFEKPLLGYKFDNFSSHHTSHSTAHNQYLESLFKTGLVGSFIYYFIFLLLAWSVSKKAFSPSVADQDKVGLKAFLCLLVAVMIGNLSQSNFTYSQTGNVIFFMLGFFSLSIFSQPFDNDGNVR